MNNYNCTCSVNTNEQKCKVHRKSRYRNPWKREDEQPKSADEETSE